MNKATKWKNESAIAEHPSLMQVLQLAIFAQSHGILTQSRFEAAFEAVISGKCCDFSQALVECCDLCDTDVQYLRAKLRDLDEQLDSLDEAIQSLEQYSKPAGQSSEQPDNSLASNRSKRVSSIDNKLTRLDDSHSAGKRRTRRKQTAFDQPPTSAHGEGYSDNNTYWGEQWRALLMFFVRKVRTVVGWTTDHLKLLVAAAAFSIIVAGAGVAWWQFSGLDKNPETSPKVGLANKAQEPVIPANIASEDSESDSSRFANDVESLPDADSDLASESETTKDQSSDSTGTMELPDRTSEQPSRHQSEIDRLFGDSKTDIPSHVESMWEAVGLAEKGKIEEALEDLSTISAARLTSSQDTLHLKQVQLALLIDAKEFEQALDILLGSELASSDDAVWLFQFGRWLFKSDREFVPTAIQRIAALPPTERNSLVLSWCRIKSGTTIDSDTTRATVPAELVHPVQRLFLAAASVRIKDVDGARRWADDAQEALQLEWEKLEFADLEDWYLKKCFLDISVAMDSFQSKLETM